MSIPPRFLDEIRSRITLSDLIGRKIKVTRAGREFKACCPFHHEKTPSFTINDDKQFYHCFGCGAHGDAIGFVMAHDNLSFMDAVETLSAEAGLQMPKPDPQAVAKAEKARGLHELMDEATRWMQGQVENFPEVLQYLEQRGMNADIRAQFRIGYAPADGQAMRKVLKAKGFSDEQMIEAGVLKKATRGGEPYIFFRDRVMFPVGDRRGRVVAFGGRILPEHIRPQTNPDYTPAKYMNSSDTPLFDKGRMLYGESMARQAVREGHTLLVTEGYMDVIACHKYGFKGAVAPMGTALTEDQILSLWQIINGTEKLPILCFDGDNAGRSAAGRACERLMPLLKAGKTVRFAFLPEGEDPDSLLRSSGPQGFKTFLSSALSLFDFMWATHTQGRSFETPESRAGLTKALNDQISQIADPEVQRHYKELVRTRISETFFTSYNKRQGGAPKTGANKRVAGLKLRTPTNSKHRLSEKILVATIINNPVIYADIEEEFGSFTVQDENTNRLRQNVISILNNDPDLDFEALQSQLNANGFEKEMHDILNESVYVHAAFARSESEEGVDYGPKKTAWMSVYAALQGQGMEAERKEYWKKAFENSNEAEEEKLREMAFIQSEN
jgi:DNA primase